MDQVAAQVQLTLYGNLPVFVLRSRVLIIEVVVPLIRSAQNVGTALFCAGMLLEGPCTSEFTGTNTVTILEWAFRPIISGASVFGGEYTMAANQVVLYFDKQEDALLFTLAASSAMSAEEPVRASEAGMKMAKEICKATRITTEGELSIEGSVA